MDTLTYNQQPPQRDWLHVATIGPHCANSISQPAMDIVARIAQKHGVRIGEIFSSRKDFKVVRARHEAIIAIDEAFPRWSLPMMGRFFDRDHTTIFHCLKKAGRRT